jgi:predicted nucleotidyltransferase
LKLFWLNLDEVKGLLTKAVLKLAKRHPEILEIWLFGSLARGQAVPGSDADVLLILKESDLPF